MSKGLENWLGEALFVRHANGVELSDRAKALVPEASRLLDEIATLLPPAQEENNSVSVTISAPRAFADGWLGPRLADFQNDNPGITVFLDAEDKQSHPERNVTADLMISRMPATNDSLLSELLFEDRIMPVCTEQYRDLMGLDHAEGWKSVTLLHDALWEKDWPLWGTQQPDVRLDWLAGPRYPNHWLLLEAARQGARGRHGSYGSGRRLPEGSDRLYRWRCQPVETGDSYFPHKTTGPSLTGGHSTARLASGCMRESPNTSSR